MHEYVASLHTEGEVIALFFALFAVVLLGVLVRIAMLLTRMHTTLQSHGMTMAAPLPSGGQQTIPYKRAA